MKAFMAMIIPMGEGVGGPGNPGGPPVGPGGPPPQVNWPTFPTNPIARPPWGWGSNPPGGPGTPPLGIWGGSGVGDYVDAGLPGPQPGQPPRPWGPVFYPDQGLPGNQPGIWPGKPPYVDIGFPGPQPGHPPGIWGGPWYPPVIWDPSRPTNPIVNPGDPNNPEGDRQPRVEWKTAWSPSTGWVVIGIPTGPTPTPSSEESDK